MLGVKVCHFVTRLCFAKNGFVWGVRKRLGGCFRCEKALKEV
jgi:hypothetical protein